MMNACPRWSFLSAPLLLALGCSSAVPAPAQGALTLYVGTAVSGPSGTGCPAPGATYQVAAVDAQTKTFAPPSASTPGQSLISGDDNSSISCSVKQSGSSFVFSGSFSGITPQNDTVNVRIQNGTIDAAAQTVGSGVVGTADVTISTTQLQSGYSSTMPCTFTVQNGQIKAGAIWATFSCAQLSSPPNNVCGINSASAIVLQSCDD